MTQNARSPALVFRTLQQVPAVWQYRCCLRQANGKKQWEVFAWTDCTRSRGGWMSTIVVTRASWQLPCLAAMWRTWLTSRERKELVLPRLSSGCFLAIGRRKQSRLSSYTRRRRSSARNKQMWQGLVLRKKCDSREKQARAHSMTP